MTNNIWISPLRPCGRLRETSAAQRACEVAGAVIEREVECGATHAEALEAYVRDSASTFLKC